MTKPYQEDQGEPFFITVEVEADLVAAGHVFEQPGHVRTKSLREVLVGLPDGELAAWPDALSKGEIERRLTGQDHSV